MPSDLKLPRAILEALDSSEASAEEPPISQLTGREAGELVAGVADLIAPSVPMSRVRERLEQSVSVAPLRYAPFFSRLSRLFDQDEAEIERSIGRLKDAGCWTKTGLSGVSRVEVTPGPRLKGARTSFVRFAPGAHFPAHRHLGFEQVFVLEGSYTDDVGVEHGPGNLHEMTEGSEHEFWVAKDGPCIAASILHAGLRFTRFPARLFNPFMKK